MERRHSTIGFLRITASQLRRLAERAPEIADELRGMAQQLETEADDLGQILSLRPKHSGAAAGASPPGIFKKSGGAPLAQQRGAKPAMMR